MNYDITFCRFLLTLSTIKIKVYLVANKTNLQF